MGNWTCLNTNAGVLRANAGLTQNPGLLLALDVHFIPQHPRNSAFVICLYA